MISRTSTPALARWLRAPPLVALLLFAGCEGRQINTPEEMIASPDSPQPPGKLQGVGQVVIEVDMLTGGESSQQSGSQSAYRTSQSIAAPLTSEHLHQMGVDCEGCWDQILENQKITLRLMARPFLLEGVDFKRTAAGDAIAAMSCVNCRVRSAELRGVGPSPLPFELAPGDVFEAVLQVVALQRGPFTVRFDLEAARIEVPASTTYTFTDLGTLGGRFSAAYGISPDGVVGESELGGDDLPPPHAFLWKNGTMIDLGTVEEDGGSGVAYAINSSGTIVGKSDDRAVIWKDGVITDLGPGTASGINANGAVVGGAHNPRGDFEAVLWRDGIRSFLGYFADPREGGAESRAYGINESNVVVGVSANSEGYYNAFRWENGVMENLGTLGASAFFSHNEARAINASGSIVGMARTAEGRSHAFLWKDGVMTDLGTLGGSYSAAYAIGPAGDVVGESQTAAGDMHAFHWKDGVLTDLGVLPNLVGLRSTARGISDDGRIVGWTGTSVDRRAFVLTKVSGDTP